MGRWAVPTLQLLNRIFCMVFILKSKSRIFLIYCILERQMTIKPGVEFIAPFRIYLPEKFYMVTLGEKCHLAKPLALPPIKTNEGTQVNGRNIEISHDIFGYAGRTKFSIVIDKEIDIQADDWKQVFVNDESFLIDEAIAVANRILDVYRDQDRNSLNDKSFHVIPLVKSDLYSFRIVAIDQEFNDKLIGFEIVKKLALLIVTFFLFSNND